MESRLVLTAADMTAGAFDSMTRRGKEAYGKVEQAAADSANGAALAIAGALGGALTFAGLAQFTLSIAQSIDALNDAADATGSTIEKMSALDDFARRTGTTLGEVTGVVLQLQKSLAKAGSDEDTGVAAALKSIGLSASELKKLDAADALKVLADRLAEFDDGPNKARLIQRLLKDATGAAPILKDLAEQQELVGKVSKAQADEVDKLMKAWAGLTAEGHSFAVSVGNNVIPALNSVIDYARKASAEGGTLTRVLSTIFNGPALKAGSFVSGLVGPLDETARATKKVQDAMAGLADAKDKLAKNKASESAAPDLLRWVVTANIRSATADVKKYSDELQKAQAELADLNKASAAPPAGKPLKSVPDIPDVAKPVRAAKKEVDEFEVSFSRLLKTLAGNSMKNTGLDPSYWKDVETLWSGYQKGRLSLDEYRSAVDALTSSQKFHQDAVSASAKAQEELIKLQESFAAMRDKEVAALEQEALSREQEAEQFGLTAAAIAKVTLARAEERLAAAKSNLESDETVARLEAEVAARRRIAEATASIEVAESNKRAADDAAREWQRVSDDIGRGLTDAIFEGGKDGWSLLKKTIEAQVIRAVIQPALSGGINSVLQQMGVGPSSGSAGMPGGGFNFSSLANSNLGAQLGLSQYDPWSGGSQLTSLGESAQMLSEAAPYVYAAYQGFSEGKWGRAAGTAIGAYFGGPIGAYIGGEIGGTLDHTPTYHKGGAYTASTGGMNYAANANNTPGFNLNWGAYRSDRSADYDNLTKNLSAGLANQTAAYLGLFGGQLKGMSFTTRFASDNDDWSEGAVRVMDDFGNTLFESVKRYTADASKAAEEFGADTARALLGALQSADLDAEFETMFATLDPLTASIEDINALFSEATKIQGALAFRAEGLLQALDRSSMSAFSSMLELGDTLRALAKSGTATTDQLTAAMQSSYNASLSVLQNIKSAQSSISQGFANSIRNVELSVLDDQGKYAYFDAETARWMDLLKGLTDPDQISEYGSRILSNLDASYGLLGASQQQDTSQEFIDRYRAAEDLINARLAESQQQTLSDTQALSDALKTALLQGFTDAAAALEQAGKTIPAQIDIKVSVANGGVSEVGVYVPGQNYAG